MAKIRTMFGMAPNAPLADVNAEIDRRTASDEAAGTEGAAAGAEVEDKEAVADPEPSEPTTTNITAAQLTDAANNYLIDNDGNLSGFEAHFHATHPIGLGNGLTYDEITASINEMTANAHKPPMDLRA